MAFEIQKNKVVQTFEPETVLSIDFPQGGLIEIDQRRFEFYEPKPGARLEICGESPLNRIPILSLYQRVPSSRPSAVESGEPVQELALIREWVLAPGEHAFITPHNDAGISEDLWSEDGVRVTVS